MQVLANSLKTNHHCVLSCIKYEVLGKRSIFDSYKTFCERIGDDVMGYPEFEFWYMRFYNGDMDMDYERSKDPKPLELLQLPVEIVGKVVEKLDLPSRLKLRNVCKPLRTIVDGCKMKFQSVKLWPDGVNLSFGVDQQIRYDLNSDKCGFTIAYGGRKDQKNGVDLVDFALNDLKAMMKSHNLELGYLKIYNYPKNSNLVERAVNCLKEISDFSKTQLKVKTFEIHSAHTEIIVPCLALLKPGFLEDIYVDHISDEISNTEQWRQAKIGRVPRGFSGVNPAEIKRFQHFEEFIVSAKFMSADVMVQLRETLLTSPSFKKCKIEIYSNPQLTIQMVSTALGLPIQSEEIHVPIPGSTDVLVIKVFGFRIVIKRIFL